MMRAELLTADAPGWRAFLGIAQHDFYHLPSYVRLCARQEQGEAVALHVQDGDRRLLVPLVVRPIPGGGEDAISPYGYPGPLVIGPSDDGFLGEALRHGARHLANTGLVSLFIRFHPILNDAPPTDVGVTVRHGDTVVVDLSLDERELWRQTRENHRNQINRARRAGHTVVFDASAERFAMFCQLYRETMSRLGAMPSYRFGDDYFEGLHRSLGDRLILGSVEIDGMVAASALFTETCGIVEYHLSGSDDRFHCHQPTKLLLHEARRRAKSRGDRWFHLGGGLGATDDSLMHFKVGFSELRRPYHTLRVVLRWDEYMRLSGDRGVELGAAQPTDYFPAYRRPSVSAEPLLVRSRDL